MSVAVCNIDAIGLFSDVVSLAVTDGAAVSHTISSGKKGVLFMNVGSSWCWMGGSTVDASTSRGIIMLPRVYFKFGQAKTTLQVYFQCESGDSTTVGVVEYA